MSWELFENKKGRPQSFDHDYAETRFLLGDSPREIAGDLDVNPKAVRLMLWKKGYDLVAVRRAVQRLP